MSSVVGLRKRFAWLSCLALAILALAYGASRLLPGYEYAGTLVEGAPAVESFDLRGVDGSVALPDAFQGKTTLVFFGFTSCTDICPVTMSRLANIYRDLGEPDDVQVVMVTVDPARDTPEDVTTYVQRFHPDFVGLGGDEEALARAARAFFVGHHHAGGEDLAHSGHVTVLDPGGRMRLIYRQDRVHLLEDDLEHVLRMGRWT